MTTSKRLAAHRASAANEDPQVSPAPVGPGKDEKPTNPDKEKPSMPTEDEMAAAAEAARKEAHTSGFKAANERMNKVFASEHYVGREALAQSLLASEALSAEDVIGHLEKAPKAAAETTTALTAEQQQAASEAAAREEMKKAIAETGNSNIDADGGKKPDKKAEADSVWTKAYGLNKEGK
ncbi:hypothetical protein SAMIE_1015430 [Sphingobium amiense]|uniref:Uncharacterized protein n=1 Tax=Sphingobium amiense TaxID=135719 RepID=A0A494WBW5_9SPHN|nr:hypothetical protein [Sphingobium amiense]BBD98042.1 hypothetical protein SAMIE_1015430 [Sphingobium amiense]